ncbi:MAG: hypothetical protein H6Q75_286 [Firmicutes bacterium]|nr:hypothetical protein [Bacillota bacterium]
MSRKEPEFIFLGFKKEKGFCREEELKPEDFYPQEDIPPEIRSRIAKAFAEVLGRRVVSKEEQQPPIP